MNKLYTALIIYFALINFTACLFTASDKLLAKKGKRRISEACLFTLALFGGACGEYLTMKVIRHKTRHRKFMIGLPLIILLQLITVMIFVLY